jgi:hypothetical protein
MTPAAKLKHQRFAIWCAPIFTVLTVVGWLGIAHFWAPAPADLTAADTAVWYTQTYRFGNLLGNSLFILASCFLIVWSNQFSLMLAEIEGKLPLWAVTQAACGSIIAVIVILNCSFWISAAYRPGAHPDVVVAFNDAAWMGFLLAWPVLSLEMIAGSLIALNDSRAQPLIPHWFSKTSIAAAIVLITAAGPAFTYSGPFAYHGALGFYLPMFIWICWMNGHAWYMHRALVAQTDTERALNPAAVVAG